MLKNNSQINDSVITSFEEFPSALPDGDWQLFRRKLDIALSRKARRRSILTFWLLLPAGVLAIIAVLLVITRTSSDDDSVLHLKDESITAQAIVPSQTENIGTLICKDARPVIHKPEPTKKQDARLGTETIPESAPSGDDNIGENENEPLSVTVDTIKASANTTLKDSSKYNKHQKFSLFPPISGLLANGIAIGMASHGTKMSLPASATVPGFTFPHRDYTKHYLPLTTGISFRYSLSHKWSIVSGLDYSLYISDFTPDKKQKVHYLGVPVRLDYHIYDFGRISLYSGLGMKADWCIDTNVYVHNMSHSPAIIPHLCCILQYDLSPVFSLYLEPTVSLLMTAPGPNGIYTYRDSNRLYYSTSLGFRININ